MVELGLTGDVMLGRLVDERYRSGDRLPGDVWGTMRDRSEPFGTTFDRDGEALILAV